MHVNHGCAFEPSVLKLRQQWALIIISVEVMPTIKIDQDKNVAQPFTDITVPCNVRATD